MDPNFTVMAALFSYSSAIDVENYNSRPLGTLYTLGRVDGAGYSRHNQYRHYEGAVGEHPV